MALFSRQFEILTAIKAALDSDPDVGAANRWLLRKLSFHTGKTWNAGYYLSPLKPREKPFENRMDWLVYPVLAAFIDPSAEGDLVSKLSESSAVIERVEDIFRNKTNTDAPASLRSLGSSHTGHEAYAFQLSTVDAAERFLSAALQNGYDGMACIINVEVSVARRNVSSLGS